MARHSGRLELTWTDKEKTLLSTGDGKYDYTFVDPSDHRVSEVRLLREVDRIGTETPAEHPADRPPPTTDNLLITGDSMHVLDALTKIPDYADKYLGKVRLVYIDPPFNTGDTFANYEDNISHSIWLTMLRDRLKQIRDLLADNGTIWVHLDDVEVHRCRAVMDEELGPQNFIASFLWRKVDSPNDNKVTVTTDHETILVYGKGSKTWTRKADQGLIKAYGQVDEETGRRYRDRLLKKNGKNSLREDRPTMWYPIKGPDGIEVWPIHDDGREANWALGEKTVRQLEADGLLIWKQRDDGNGGLKWVPYTREWAPDDPERPWPTIWSDLPTTRQAKAHLKSLGLDGFDTPKPERLLERIITIASDPGDVVLDCFAGSGTTAAVAHKLGRRWVTSELRSDTLAQYTKPRLSMVVHGEDTGGISTLVTREAATGVSLPEKVSADEAQKFQQVLRKVLADGEDPEADEEALDETEPLTVALDKALAKALRAAAKGGTSPLSAEETKTALALLRKIGGHDVAVLDITKPVQSALVTRTNTTEVKMRQWFGGGGFTHLAVGPSMFEVVEGFVCLADWATQGDLARAMCAQLEVRYSPDGIFAARKGGVRYVVLDGLVGETTVASIIDQLGDRQIVEVWATQYVDSAADLLRKERPGSRLEAIPDSVLDRYRRKAAKGSPFAKKETRSE